ncbi:MAG TPA: hypothetical protein VFZ16_20040 [Hyphomicrobiaceae bacterium]|nr:hypothetical protein [Hyphomicrobiaceae bacterium]
MAIWKRASSQALMLAGVLLTGCAVEGSDGIFTTGSLTGQSANGGKADPACVALATRIEALRKDGIPDKIEKAAVKRYKLTKADLSKADDLNKANAEFQARCSTVKPTTTTAAASTAAPAAKAAPKKTVKASTAPSTKKH